MYFPSPNLFQYPFSTAEDPAANVKRSLQAAERKCYQDRREAKNAERDCHRKFIRLGFSLPLPLHQVTHTLGGGNTLTMTCARIEDYLKYLVVKAPSLVAGNGDSLAIQLKAFWHMYRYKHPSHTVYHDRPPQSLERTIPIVLYGDEGKGPKRDNFLEFTVESPIGSSRLKPCQCSCKDEVRHLPDVPTFNGRVDESDLCGIAATMSTNQKGHCYLNSFLLFGLARYIYGSHPEIVQKHLEIVATEAHRLYEEGFTVVGEEAPYFCALVGVKGDMKFHKEIVGFTRCYATMGNNLMMCAYCFAGDAAYRFDECLHEPQWAQTCFAQRPWDEDPPFAKIPFDRGRPEWMYKLDPFHVQKLGVSRDIVGSSIVVLARMGYFDYDNNESKSLEARLERAHGHFRLWCCSEKKSPGLRSFTKNFLNAQTQATTPWVNAKGSDVTLLLGWLRFLAVQLLNDGSDHGVGAEKFLKLLKSLISKVLGMHKILETHGLFLERSCAQNLYMKIMMIAKGYMLLAGIALQRGYVAYGVKPKYHALKHLAFEIREVLCQTAAPMVVSPAVFNCEGNEDHVGRISKLSRQLDTRTLTRRLFQRYFLKTKALIVRHCKK